MMNARRIGISVGIVFGIIFACTFATDALQAQNPFAQDALHQLVPAFLTVAVPLAGIAIATNALLRDAEPHARERFRRLATVVVGTTLAFLIIGRALGGRGFLPYLAVFAAAEALLALERGTIRDQLLAPYGDLGVASRAVLAASFVGLIIALLPVVTTYFGYYFGSHGLGAWPVMALIVSFPATSFVFVAGYCLALTYRPGVAASRPEISA